LRTCAKMRNSFSGDNRSRATRCQEIGATNPRSEETCRVEVPCACRVEKFCGHCGNINTLAVRRNDDRPGVATSKASDRAMSCHPTSCFLEVVNLVERANFILIREENVDVMFDDLKEFGTMAIDAEAVGKRERHPSSCTCRPAHHIAKCALGRGFVPQISLEIDNASCWHKRKINVLGRQLPGDTK